MAAAAAEVADPAYGEGNWSFNTAWAAQLTGDAFVTRRSPDVIRTGRSSDQNV